MSSETEKRNKTIGMGVSIGIHTLILILFFLIMAWREPDPPVPEYGIELNFGLDAAGTGAVQPEQAATPAIIEEEQLIEEQVIEEPDETPVEESPVEAAPAQDMPAVEEQVEQQEIIEDSEMEDSPDVIEPEQAQPEPEEEPVVAKETTVETPREQVQEQVVEEEPVPERVQEETITRDADVNQAENDQRGTLDESEGDVESVSQGDDTDATGDEGDPQGSLEERALYGNYGGGGGPLLELSGWTWDSRPNPNDTSNENGKIVFEIKIDDMGYIISVRTLERTVSPAVEAIYKSEVESLTFSPISSSTIPAAVSTGKITFIIRSK